MARHVRLRFEWAPGDCCLGLVMRQSLLGELPGPFRAHFAVWIYLVPFFPVHLCWDWPPEVDLQKESGSAHG